jgi:multicomponent Na+:H+ antiporter subunit D
MSVEQVMALAVALPLVAMVTSALLHRTPNLRDAASVLVGVVTFGLVAFRLAPEVLAGARPTLDLGEVLPGVSLLLRLEPLGLLFALIASGLWIVTTIYAVGYMRAHDETNQSRFFACFALAISAALAVACAGNLLTLFIGYEVLTLSTYPLVTHHRSPEAMRSGRVYLGILLSTSIGLLLLAIVWTWVAAGTLDFRAGGILEGKLDEGLVPLLLALYVFGTGKAAVMPLHRWLPAAMVAPTPVSALLHAVAVVKAGVFSVLKIVVYVFGIDLLSATGAAQWLSWVAAFTVLAASIVALRKDNLKARLAYSTVSQLSYIVLGASLANAMGVVGGGMHIATHAFGKITLFFCAGAIYVAAHKTEVSDMQGIGRRMPVTTFAFLIGALSVIGLPPMGGSWSKWFLALGAAQLGMGILVAVLMVSSLLNVAYLMPIVVRGFFLPQPEGAPDGVKEAPLFCVVPLCFTALGCIVLFFYGDALYRLLLPVAGGLP